MTQRTLDILTLLGRAALAVLTLAALWAAYVIGAAIF